jgi:PAS domain S-box-containing protein
MALKRPGVQDAEILSRRSRSAAANQRTPSRVNRISSLKVRSIVLAMAVTLMASAAFQISSYRNARQVEQIGNRDAHVRDVLSALAALRMAVQDAAIGRDGYAVTGGLDDLKLYRNAAARVPLLVGQVRALTADDPAQAEFARRLPSLCEKELQELESGPHTMEGQVRQVIDQMIEAEQQIRAECLSQTHAMASSQARSLIAASIYRVFVLLAGCTLILHQQARQRRTERMCRQKEEFFRNAFDHAATGMALADEGGRWVKANHALCELLGYAEAELLPIAPRSIAPLEDLDKQRAAADELRAGRTDRHQLEMRYVHKDGRTVWALVTTSLVRDEKGRPQTFIS